MQATTVRIGRPTNLQPCLRRGFLRTDDTRRLFVRRRFLRDRNGKVCTAGEEKTRRTGGTAAKEPPACTARLRTAANAYTLVRSRNHSPHNRSRKRHSTRRLQSVIRCHFCLVPCDLASLSWIYHWVEL